MHRHRYPWKLQIRRYQPEIRNQEYDAYFVSYALKLAQTINKTLEILDINKHPFSLEM